MTISSATRTAGPFTGTGAASNFPFAFKVFQAADLYVAIVLIATGVETDLALTADYTVALNANQDSNPGGTVTLVAGPLAAGYRLVISSAIGNLQATEYLNQGGFYPEILTASLDRATILIQQLQAYLAMALQFPLTDAGPNNVLPSAEIRAGKLLMFDSYGNPSLVSLAPGSTLLTGQGAEGTIDGVNAEFTFTSLKASGPLPMVFVGGVYQTPGVDYPAPTNTIGSTWQLTFTVPPAAGPVTVVDFA